MADQVLRITGLDRIRIEIWADSHLRDYYGRRSSLLSFGEGDAVRYTSESFLNEHRRAAYTLREVCAVVREYMEAHRFLLELTEAQAYERKAAREANVQALSNAADLVSLRGASEEAYQLLDAAEQMDPDRYPWARLRAMVANRAKAREGVPE